MKRHILYLLATLLCLVACSDDPFDGNGNNINGDTPFEGGNVTITLRLPDYDKATVGSRAMNESSIAMTDGKPMIYVMAYSGSPTDGGKSFLQLYTPADVTFTATSNAGEYTATLDLPKGTTFIEAVANATIAESDLKDDSGNALSLSSKTASDYTSGTDSYPVSWSYANISSLLDGDYKIQLIRQRARVTLALGETVAKAGNFTVSNVYLVNYATVGTVAPAFSNINSGIASAVTLPSNPTYKTCTATTDAIKLDSHTATTDDPYTFVGYAYETPAEQKARIVVEATFKNTTYYYPLDIAYDNNGTFTHYPLLRNHSYDITINSVNSMGYNTFSDAANSTTPAENRLTVSVKDDNPAIKDMIACKDYHLGTSDTAYVDNTSTTATVNVVSTYSYGSYAVTNSKQTDWITNIAQTSTTDVPDNNTSTNSTTGKLYTYTLTLAANDKSDQPRTGSIIFQSGDLSRTLIVIQQGKDFKRSEERKTQLWSTTSSSTAISTDYFNSFIDNSSQAATGVIGNGVTAAQMRAERNQGLHFTFGTNTWYYLIPKKSGDAVSSANTSRYTVTESNDYWKVALVSGASSTDLWVDDGFTITNNGESITYPVYHTGIFQNITSSLDSYELGTKTKAGWYYYEVVKVQGKNTTNNYTYYMLDRNLGATSNLYYSSSTAGYKTNTAAIGAYFKIKNAIDKTSNDAKIKTVDGTVTPTGYTAQATGMSSAGAFSIPTTTQLNDVPLTVETCTTALGELYYRPTIKTTDSPLTEVYLNRCGYLENEALMYENHATLWTKTYVAGNQGFSTSSPDYGFWYYYEDINGSIIGQPTMRFVDGTAGQTGTLYRAMPIRCIIGAEPSDDTSYREATGSTIKYSYNLTIYYVNSKNRPYMWMWSSSNNNNYTGSNWPGVNITNSSDVNSKFHSPTNNSAKGTVVTYGTTKSGNNTIYKITISENEMDSNIKPNRVIFSGDGNSNQTADLLLTYEHNNTETKTLEDGTYCDVKTYTCTAYFNSEGAIKSLDDANAEITGTYYTPVIDKADEVSFFLLTDYGVSSAGCYAWKYGAGDYVKDWDSTTDNMEYKGLYKWNDTTYKIWKWTYQKTDETKEHEYNYDKSVSVIFRANGNQSATFYSPTRNGIFYYDGGYMTIATYIDQVTNVATSNTLSSNAISRSASGTVKIGSAYWQQQAQKSKWYSIGK